MPDYLTSVDGVVRKMTPAERAEHDAWIAGAAERNAPPPPTLGQRMEATFNQLPTHVRAKFAPLKYAIERELERNDIDMVREIITQADVPPELAPIKASLLGLLNVPA